MWQCKQSQARSEAVSQCAARGEQRLDKSLDKPAWGELRKPLGRQIRQRKAFIRAERDTNLATLLGTSKKKSSNSLFEDMVESRVNNGRSKLSSDYSRSPKLSRAKACTNVKGCQCRLGVAYAGRLLSGGFSKHVTSASRWVAAGRSLSFSLSGPAVTASVMLVMLSFANQRECITQVQLSLLCSANHALASFATADPRRIPSL